MNKLTIFVFTLLFAVAVPMVSLANEGPGMPGMSCGMSSCGTKGMMQGKGMEGMMHGRGMEGERGGFGQMGELMEGRLPGFYIMHAQDLKLTDDQLASLKKISFDVKKDFISKGADVQLKRLELKEIIESPDYKVEDATAKLKEVEDARLALETAVLQHAVDARGVLTPEQLKSLKDMRGHKGCGGSCCNKMKNKMGEKKEGAK